jgi:GrpB-like predicted nucleotidyltransferase (UPF0157 family)
MESDIELGVATMFRDATQNSIVLELRTPADWERYTDIRDTSLAREKQEVAHYTRDKPQLLADARKALIDKAGALTPEHPTPLGTDRFNESAIDRQAHIKVENDHQARLLGIRQDESAGYADLKQDIHARENVRDQARDAFTRTVDRRSGEDCRMPTRSR